MLPFASFSLLATLLAPCARCEDLNFAFPFDATTPTNFEVDVDPDFLEFTHQKVASYRPSIDLRDYPDWADGPPPHDVNSLAAYWNTTYDWPELQQQININFSHYAVNIPGTRNYPSHDIHVDFIHEPSSNSSAIPILLLHGWPSTSLMWNKLINPLSHPSDSVSPSFHVVAPDLPGFGFSPAAEYEGLGPREMAMHSTPSCTSSATLAMPFRAPTLAGL
jgi:hypothetical protein